MRRTSSIGPEGWYYLFVVLFIIGGAVLREVNLLVILGGMMVGPLIFNWRYSVLTLRDLHVTRRLPVRVAAGEPFRVFIRIANNRSRLPSRALIVQDTIDCPGDHPPKSVELLVPRVDAGGSATASYRLLLPHRGIVTLGPLHVTTRYPLGLVRGLLADQQATKVIVYPRRGRLKQAWRKLAQAQHVGAQQVRPRRGLLEGDYYGLREWRSGDSRRWIHWRTSAKLGVLAVRQFEQQTQHDLALVLDLWSPSIPDEAARAAVELAISFAATVVQQVCQTGGSRVLLSIHGAESRTWTASASPVLAEETNEFLATLEPGAHESIRELPRLHHRDHRLVVISTRSRSSTAVDVGGSLNWIDVGAGDAKRYFQSGP